MNTTELKAVESALEDALDKVRQLIPSDPEPKRMVGVPLCEAPHVGAPYWTILSTGEVHKVHWRDSATGHQCLAQGNVFASRRDAEYKAAFDAIWGQPIGEWGPDSVCWFVTVENTAWWTRAEPTPGYTHRLWRKGEIGFGDAGKAELERRLAEQKKLDERFGL